MIRPLSLFIGLRYTRAKQRNHFISFISLASMLGIALGVAVLITVLSVMNGFDYQIRARFFEMIPEVTVTSNIQQSEVVWNKATAIIEGFSPVVATSPFVSGNAMVINGGIINGLQLMGIDPTLEQKTSGIKQNMVKGHLDDLVVGQYNIIIGQSLAEKMNVSVGDDISIFTPQVNVTMLGVYPRHRQFHITGLFHVSESLGLDDSVAYIDIGDAKKLLSNAQGVSGLHVKLADIYDALDVTPQIYNALTPSFWVTNWTDTAGAFFSALKMEKTMMFIILLLIIAVAVFNLVSSLVMTVNDKRSDIAILRTIGASPSMIMRTFIIQGTLIGFIGTALGVAGGVVLSLNVTAITNWIQKVFNVQLISSKVYVIDYLPSDIHLNDLCLVAIIAFGLSILSTIYPAWVAFRTQPAEALRYE